MPRARRSRYTATLQRPGVGVVQRVILAPSADSVLPHYVAQGWTVLQVVKGDRVNRPRVDGGGWALTPDALRAARERLGIRQPVVVKQTGHQGGRWGAHSLRVKDGRPYHHITIKSWLTPEQAGQTLWHELAHAMQAERAARRYATRAYSTPGAFEALAPSEWTAAWRNAPERSGPYRTRPIEVEARRHEQLHNVRPLTRPLDRTRQVA